MSNVLVLDDGVAIAEVWPDDGGAIGAYVFRDGRHSVPIFQTAPSPDRTGPFARGCNILVPFSNRISGGGFHYAGDFHAVPQNLPGEPYSNHGNAFQSRWTVTQQTAISVELALEVDQWGPFSYRAQLRCGLAEGGLTMALHVTNAGDRALPFGLGFHPWFVRTPSTLLSFKASGVWSERPDHLPDQRYDLTRKPELDFERPVPIPDRWLNNAFTGWDSGALIRWPDRQLEVEIRAAPNLRTLIVYSPSGASDYVCVEPVSHGVDTHNSAHPMTDGPTMLVPGASLTGKITCLPRSWRP